MHSQPARPPSHCSTKAKPATDSALLARIAPHKRARIAVLAAKGVTYAAIARECHVSRATAHKYGIASRPAPDNRVHLNELELFNLRQLARAVVSVPCPRCKAPFTSLAFLPSTRCPRCGMALQVPFSVRGRA